VNVFFDFHGVFYFDERNDFRQENDKLRRILFL